MAKSITIKGAHCILYVAGKKYVEARDVRYTVDYGEKTIYGIDTPFAQEIGTSRISVQGQVSGIRLIDSGGLQGKSARPKINQTLQGSYVSIRLKDRKTNKDILYLPEAKITSENIQAAAKGLVLHNFNFVGIIPYGEVETA